MFFNVSGNPALSQTAAGSKAVLSGGSSVVFPPSPATGPGGDVGGEWAYDFNGSGLAGSVSQHYGISSGDIEPLDLGRRTGAEDE